MTIKEHTSQSSAPSSSVYTSGGTTTTTTSTTTATTSTAAVIAGTDEFNSDRNKSLLTSAYKYFGGEWQMVNAVHNKMNCIFNFSKGYKKSKIVDQSYIEEIYGYSGSFCCCFPWSKEGVIRIVPTSETLYQVYTTPEDSTKPPFECNVSTSPGGWKILESKDEKGGQSRIEFQGRDKFLQTVSAPDKSFELKLQFERK